MQSKEEA
jgi:calcium-dependent protein kinase